MSDAGATRAAPRTRAARVARVSGALTRVSGAVARNPRWVAVAGLSLAALVAYRYTLASLAGDLELDTPLAYLPLLPFFSAFLAIRAVHRHEQAPPPAGDRTIDLIVGIPVLGVALFLVTALPALASTYYWSDRPDVLSLAFFVSGTVIVCFGLGWFWRLRWAMLFLFLMWPGLYLHAMSGLLGGFSTATNAVLAAVVVHVPIGARLSGATGVLLVHQPSGAPLSVSVSTACAGSDSVLGFALVGGALLTTRAGSLRRRLSWLCVGMALDFVLNVARITSILALAAAGHARLALGGYHAVIGLLLFTAVVAAMVALLPRFGLTAQHPPALPSPPVLPVGFGRSLRRDPPTTPAPPGAPRSPAGAPARRSRRRRWLLGTLGVGALTIATSLADAGLAPYAAFADGTGSPTVAAFSAHLVPSGWQADPIADYPWARQYFGSGASFVRYLLTLPSGSDVYADVVSTHDQATLNAYNIQSCFLFHRYRILTERRVALGHGVTGLILDYTVDGGREHWATVSWAWPVDTPGTTTYERLLLTSAAVPGGDGGVALPAPRHSGATGWQKVFLDLINAATGHSADAADLVWFQRTNAGLTATAHDLVATTLRDSAS